METYAVLLAEEIAVPLHIAEPLAAVLECRPGEITRRMRNHPWILMQSVPAIALDPIFDILNAQNVRAKAVPEVHMPDLPPALRVRIADPLPDTFFLQAADPPAPPVIRWTDLEMVSAGLVTLAPNEARALYGKGTTVRELSGATPGSAPMGGGRPKTEEMFILDLVTGGEEEWRLRIDGARFKFDYLGGRKQPSSRENIRLLMGDIEKRAPGARFSGRAKRFLAGERAAALRFRSLASFEAYNLWLLQSVREDLAERAASEAES